MALEMKSFPLTARAAVYSYHCHCIFPSDFNFEVVQKKLKICTVSMSCGVSS